MRVYNPTTGLEREMTEQEVRQVRMFGCTEQQMREAVEESFTFRFSGPAMMAMSLMSDAQEEILRDMNEDARQTLNRAKWILSTYCMQERV